MKKKKKKLLSKWTYLPCTPRQYYSQQKDQGLGFRVFESQQDSKKTRATQFANPNFESTLQQPTKEFSQLQIMFFTSATSITEAQIIIIIKSTQHQFFPHTERMSF
jgi:hypothetical protein